MSIQIYGLTEFGELLGENWSTQKMSVYYSRGKLPEPFAIAGKRPFWTIEQIEEFKMKIKKPGNKT